VAATRDDGPARAVHCARPGHTARRARHHPVLVQVWRLVTQTPERLSLPVLAALCDVLEVTPADLITTHAENVTAPKAVRTGTTNTAAPAADLASFRPKRDRLRRDEDT
jgi:hypothetical protein